MMASTGDGEARSCAGTYWRYRRDSWPRAPLLEFVLSRWWLPLCGRSLCGVQALAATRTADVLAYTPLIGGLGAPLQPGRCLVYISTYDTNLPSGDMNFPFHDQAELQDHRSQSGYPTAVVLPWRGV